MTLTRSRTAGPLAILLATAGVASAQIKAFPQAEGFGATSVGGRGGDVYHVTNLADSGTGSLRYGVENAPSTGRTIVFDVGGWINLTSKLGVTRGRITLAGQTAPGGIGIRGKQFSVGADDLVVRHLRFRPGKAAGTDNDSINTNSSAQRVIYDHVSAEFSTDGGFDTQGADITLQYSSVSLGLLTHSTGGLIQNATGGAAGKLTFHHNLFAHNETRNPKARSELIDWRDNVIYNFHNGFIAGDSDTDVTPNWRANFDGNTYVSNVGGNASSGGRPMMTGGRTQNYDLWFGTNALDRDSDATHDPVVYTRAQAQADQNVVSSAYNWSATAFDVGSAAVWQNANPAEAMTRVLAEFGATPWARDAVNQLVHDQVLARTGRRIANETDLGLPNGGYPTLGGVAAPTDTDRDGIPDAWETRHGLSPTAASHNGDFDADGYTNLEEYLNDLAAFKAVGPLVFDGTGRYADWANWTHRWEPSRVDEVHVNTGTATLDAVGQKAGILRVGTGANANGRLDVRSGWIEITSGLQVGPNGGSGIVAQTGGTVTVLAGGSVTLTNGTYALSGGTLRTPSLSKATAAAFTFTGGTLHADTVNFDLVNQGGTLAPGNSPGLTRVNGNLTLASGTLQIELAGTARASGFDALDVSGTATLGGTLQIVPLGSFVPTPSDSFLILTASGINGGFANANAFGLVPVVGGGAAMRLTQTSTQLVLDQYTRVGDVNRDGGIDNQDIASFVTLLTQGDAGGATGYAADVDGNGVVNNQDIAPFVALLTGGRGLADVGTDPDFAPLVSLVPEPATLGLLAAGVVALRRPRGH